ncbi:MAG: hypothetical protein KGL38_03265 [Gemmatimonadota bacterium]|nr:hypothetical protein [Gemmatimonadota bacterium]MDE3126996.1 hypothetical protein [Gemmatimonadota bacterium]MDE3172311.1 hypothetical protein [Gemmatimonadota bacterium]
MPGKPKRGSPKKSAAKPETGRVTYRELRNTPGRVWERLAHDQPLTLVADGEAKAVVIPVPDGDVATALEAYRRGRALIALRRIRERARHDGTAALTLDQINEVVREVRRERHRRERED